MQDVDTGPLGIVKNDRPLSGPPGKLFPPISRNLFPPRRERVVFPGGKTFPAGQQLFCVLTVPPKLRSDPERPDPKRPSSIFRLFEFRSRRRFYARRNNVRFSRPTLAPASHSPSSPWSRLPRRART